MPALVFPSSGQTVKVTASNDYTSNATSWYLNDYTVLNTSFNTSTEKTYTFENDIFNFGSVSSVKVFTNNISDITFDSTVYTITGSDESTSNFVTNYLFETNIINSTRAASQTRTFYFNNIAGINLGSIARVRISGPGFEQLADVVANTNNSFTISLPLNWPLSFVGFTVVIGKFVAIPAASYLAEIAVSTNTNRTFTINKPVGFPDVGSNLYAIIPYGVQNVAPIAGIVSTLTNAVSAKPLVKIAHAPTFPTNVGYTKNIRIDLKTDQLRNTFAVAKSLTRATEAFVLPSRTVIASTASEIQFLSNPIRITGSNLVTNSDLSWYYNDSDIIKLNYSTSSLVTLNFINPVEPYPLGAYTKAKIVTPYYERIVDIVSNTNNSITVSQLGLELNQITTIYLGNPVDAINKRLTDTGAAPYLRKWTIPSTGTKANFGMSVIDKPTIKIKSTPVSFVTDVFRVAPQLKESITTPSRAVTRSSFTSTVYTDLIKVNGHNGITSNFINYYIFDNDQIVLTKSTSSFVTLYFTNIPSNQPSGAVTTVRVIGPKFDTIVNVQSYTGDSVTIADIFDFDNAESGNNFNDIYIRLGAVISNQSAVLSNSNVIPLVDKVKIPTTSLPNLLTAQRLLPTNIVLKDPITRIRHTDFKTTLKVIGEATQFKIETTQKSLIVVKPPLTSQSRTVTYTNFTSTVFTDLIKVTGHSGVTSNFSNYYILENNQIVTTKTTSSFVTLYFNNPNNNQNLGLISTARIIGAKFDVTVNVQNYTSDSITVADIFGFDNIEVGNNFTDVYVKLGINFPDRRVSFGDNNATPLIEKIKPQAITLPHTLTVSKFSPISSLRDNTVRFIHADFKQAVPKVSGETRIFKVEVAARANANLKEPIVLPSRITTKSNFTATIFTDLIAITGRSGVSSNFSSYYVFENNQITLSRTTGSFVTLYFVPPSASFTLATFTVARLTSTKFDITVPVQSNTIDSITVPNIFNFDDPQSSNTINDLFVRLGRNYQDSNVDYSNANRVSQLNYHKYPVAFNSTISITGNTKVIKDQNFSTVETPRISSYRSIPALRDTINYQTQSTTVANTTSTLLSAVINIGGVARSTSTYVSYYLNESDILTTFTQSTVTSTLLFDTTVSLGSTLPTSVKIFAYQNVSGVDNLRYEIILPIVSVTNNSVAVNWDVYEYKIKAQLITVVPVSGATVIRYSSPLTVSNLSQQKFKADTQKVFEISPSGKLTRQYEKLTSFPSNIVSSKFKQEISVKGVDRPIVQKTTIVTTSTATIVEPFAINVYGKTETTSTAVRWYYNEENILQTIPLGSNLVTLYFDGLPIYQRTSAPFIKLIAPNINYEFIHPVVSFTVDSVTIQNTGFIPSVSGMYFYWARIGNSYTYRYSDTGANPYLNLLRFGNFIDGVVSSSTFRTNIINKNIEKFTFGTEVPRLGRTQNIPQLRDTLQAVGKSVVSVNSSTILTYSPTPVSVYGINASTSTFVSYYINDSDILVAIPSSSQLAVLYLGNNPEYSRPIGTNVKIVNANSGYNREFAIVSSTIDSITILNPGDLPSASGTLVYYGSSQINYPSVTYSETNSVGKINYNIIANKFIEVKTDTAGKLTQSIFVKSDNVRILQNTLQKPVQLLKNSIEVPKQNNFISTTKLRETSIWQTPVYTVSTGSQILFSTPIGISGKTGSTTTFVTYYTFEDNSITEIVSNNNQKILYFAESIRPDIIFSHVRLQSYKIESGVENTIWEYLFPIINLSTSTVTINFAGPLPDSYLRASLGRYVTTYSSNFAGTNNISLISKVKITSAENYQSPQFSTLDKKTIVVRDLQPTNNFSSSNLGQPKIKVAADRTFSSTISINTLSQQVVFLEPVVLSGYNLSTSTFVSSFVNESDIITVFNSTSSLITFYFNRTVPVTNDYTIARFTNFIGYDFTSTIVSVTPQSVTIVNPTNSIVNGLSAYLGKVYPGQTYRSIIYDAALQIPTFTIPKIKVNLGSLITLEIPRQGKVQSGIILRSETQINQFTTIFFRNIPQVRGERSADPHKVKTVTTSTSVVYDNIAYKVYGTNLTTSTAVSNYLNEDNLFVTYTSTPLEVQLYLGILPGYAQLTGTHVRLVNDVGFDQQFTVTNITKDSVSIVLPKDFPQISNLYLYIGSTRSIESVRFNDTNVVPKINFKWGLWHTHVFQDRGLLDKNFISLREHVDRTRLSFLQKPVTALRSSIEVPRANKADRTIIVRETSQYQPRTVSYTTSSSILYLGPFDVTGKVGSTSTFVSTYLYDTDTVKGFVDPAVITTLYFSNYIAPITDNYSVVRVQGFDTAYDLPIYEYTFAVSTFTNNTVSFLFDGVLPGSRFKIFLGRPITATNVSYTNGNNIPVITKLKAYQGFSSIEIPRHSVLQKPITIVRDFVNNIRLGQAKSITKLAQDTSYQSISKTTVYNTTTIYTDAIPVTGINRSQTNFAQSYLQDYTGIISVINNTSSLVTLYLSQNIGYSGLHNTVKIVRYSSGSYIGNRFIIGSIEFENSYPIVSYTTSSVTINVDAGSFIDPNLRSLAAYLGQPYQQPSTTAFVNSSTLDVTNINKFVVPAAGFALERYSSKFNVSAKAVSIVTPITFSALNKATVKVVSDRNRLETGITLKPGLVVKDGFYPNLNTRTRVVTTATNIVYEPTVYKILGTDLTTSTFALTYTFDYDQLYTANKTTSTITLYLGQLPNINIGLGLYVRITDNASFNTTTQVISRDYGSIVIQEPANMPNIASLSLYFGAMRYVETVDYTDNNANVINAVFTQTSVRTSAAPSNPRERLYYAGIAASRYGSQITVYPRDLVSPINQIPAKTRAITTSSGVVWNTQSFTIYGTNLQQNTNLSWYTLDSNFITYNTNPFIVVLQLGITGASYGPGYYNQFTHIRLINPRTGYDQYFQIITYTDESVGILASPSTFPSISGLQAFFGYSQPVDILTWNDQGIVPTFSSNLAFNTGTTTATRILLTENGIISLPYNFRSVNRVIESTIYSTATNLVSRTTAPMALFTDPNAGISYLNSAPIALNSTTSVTGTVTVLGFLNLVTGQDSYTSPGTYSWTAPAGVTSVSVVAIGGGAGQKTVDFSTAWGGGGGGTGWKNNIPVSPGSSYTVVVGSGGSIDNPGGNSYFISTSTVLGGGGGRDGTNYYTGGAFTGDGGGLGGTGGQPFGNFVAGGGGGAGGYTGNGGAGGFGAGGNGSAGSGGGGGGGGGSAFIGAAGGGGVGIFGQGINGTGGGAQGGVGGGGSGGANGVAGLNDGSAGAGGAYGGGAGGRSYNTGSPTASVGSGGAVRIIYGTGRGFPSAATQGIEFRSQIKIGDILKIVDLVGTTRFVQITAVSTTTMTVNSSSLTAFTGNPSTWTVTLWDRTLYPQSSVVFTNRPTNARENLASLTLAPGLRYNRTITQGLTLSDFGNNFTPSRLITSITVKSTPRLDSVLRVESANTLTSITSSINASPKNILYYTNIAPGIRGGVYYNTSGIRPYNELGYSIRNIGIQDLVPKGVNFLVDRFPLRAVPFTSTGNLNKSAIPVQQIQTLFDKTGAIRIIPSMKSDGLKSTLEFINQPRVDKAGWNVIEVLSRGVLDRKLTVVKSGDLKNFVTDKLSAGIKVTADSSRLDKDSRIRIIQKLITTPESITPAENIKITKIPKANVQFFEVPSSSNLAKSNIIVRDILDNIKVGKTNILTYVKSLDNSIRIDYIEKLKLVKQFQQISEVPRTYDLARMNLSVKDVVSNIRPGKLGYTTNLKTSIYYDPIAFTNSQKFLDFKHITSDIRQGRLDAVNKLITSQLPIITNSLEKSLIQLAFKENDYLLSTPKVTNIQRDLKTVFASDIGLIVTAKVPSLQSIDLKTEIAKVWPNNTLKFAVNLDHRLSGQIRRLEKVGFSAISLQDIAKVKFSPQGFKEPFDIHLAVSPKGLITKLIAGKSGNLQEPSTRKTVPVQFWN